MRCPSCGSQVAEGSSICDNCDFILDKSFLGDGYTDDDTGPDAPVEEDLHDPEDDPSYPDGRGKIPKPRKSSDTNVSSGPPASSSLSVEGSRMAADVEGFLKKLWQSFKQLEFNDKLAVGGSFAMFLFTFFPWVSIEGAGNMIGLEVDGWFIILMAAATVALVYVRQQEHWQDKQQYVVFAQIGVAAITVIFLLAKMGTKVKVTRPELDLHKVVVTHVQSGMVLCFLASLAVVAAAGLLLRDKVLKK